MTARPLINPWFVDPVDKAVLIQGINDLVANVNSGRHPYELLCCSSDG